MTKIRTIARPAHRPGCFAVAQYEKGSWPTPWACQAYQGGPFGIGEEGRFYGTPAGHVKKRNNVRWLVFICNDPQCRARLLVREDDLLEHLTEQEAGK